MQGRGRLGSVLGGNGTRNAIDVDDDGYCRVGGAFGGDEREMRGMWGGRIRGVEVEQRKTYGGNWTMG